MNSEYFASTFGSTGESSSEEKYVKMSVKTQASIG